MYSSSVFAFLIGKQNIELKDSKEWQIYTLLISLAFIIVCQRETLLSQGAS